MHELSRGTVRQALRHLQDEGLIVRRPGVGSIVVAREPAADYRPLAATTADIVDFARHTRIRQPETAEVRADDELATRLGVDVGTAWFRIRGPRDAVGTTSADAPPLCWSEQYLRADLDGRQMLLDSSFDVAAMQTQRIEQEVRAEAVSAEMAAVLGVPVGSPGLVVARRHLNAEGELMSVSLHTHPGDRFSVRSVLLPVATGPADQPV